MCGSWTTNFVSACQGTSESTDPAFFRCQSSNLTVRSFDTQDAGQASTQNRHIRRVLNAFGSVLGAMLVRLFGLEPCS